MKSYFILAVENLRHRKKRAYLTIIGVFIGIMAVVALVSLGQGLEAGVNEQFSKLGVDKVFVQPAAAFQGSTGGGAAAPLGQVRQRVPLHRRDAAVRADHHARQLSPVAQRVPALPAQPRRRRAAAARLLRPRQGQRHGAAAEARPVPLHGRAGAFWRASADGEYQTGEVQARSWCFMGTSGGILMLKRTAS